MKNIDNKLEKLGEDIKNEVKIGDKMYIASAVFSMYGYEELKDRLKIIDEFGQTFISTADTSSLNNEILKKYQLINL